MPLNSSFTLKQLENGLRGHNYSLPLRKPRTPFEHALQRLFPLPMAPLVLALLDHKAKWTTVREWIRGRRPNGRFAGPPAWACEIVATKLEQQATADIELAKQIRAAVGPGRVRQAQALARWVEARHAKNEKDRLTALQKRIDAGIR